MRDLAFFLRLSARRLSWLAAGYGAMLAAALAGVALLSLSGWFVTATALAAASAVTIDVLRPSAGIRFLAVFRTAARYGERLLTHEATLRLLADLRSWLFARALPLDAAQLGRMSGGDMLSRITADIDALDNLYLRVAAPSLVALAVMALAALLLWPVDFRIALLAVAGMVLAGVAVPALSGRLGARIGRETVSLSADLRGRLVRDLQGLTELRVFGVTGRAAAAIDDSAEALARRQTAMGRLSGLSSALSTGLSGMTHVGALAIGAGLVAGMGQFGQEGSALPAPVLAAVLLGLLAVFEAVAPLPLAYLHLGRTRAAARRLREITGLVPAVTDPAVPSPAPAGCDLVLRGVSFRYGNDHPFVLREVELDLPAGRRVAIVGGSGSGKTTLARLLLRLWDPSGGEITMGGIDLRRIRQAELHARIGYLSQNDPLFNATIADNLRLGRPDATPEELWSVLEAVRLDAFVEELPDGLDTFVGEAGLLVSGGQARRLALARIMLKGAPILLLDEPTEGLDAATEAEVWQALERFMEGRTVLLITHRDAGPGAMDEIRRLDSGRLG
jgi:ATP-binding cassette, subfamily C, bacterial CydC